jgi:integrase
MVLRRPVPWRPVASRKTARHRDQFRASRAHQRAAYHHALRIPRERLGQRRAMSVVRDDVENLVDYALSQGRSRGGKPGTGLGTATVRMMLSRLSAAFEMAVDDGKLPRNPARKVRVTGGAKAPRQTWSEDEVRRFITAVSGDRLAAVWLLSLLGLRRGEVCGLKWADVSFTDATLSIRQTHVTVGGEVIEKGPKSRRGYRVLPLFEPVSSALLALYERQVAESKAAGAAYAGDVDDGYVCCDELGQPVNPQTYSDAFARLCKAAGLPKIRLHDCRHSTNSLLEHLGVSDSIRAQWFGHTLAVNRDVYTHSRPEDLAVISGALGGLFSEAV